MKKVFITILLGLVYAYAQAQPAYNYSKFDFGLSGAAGKAFTDEQTNTIGPAGAAGITYNQTPFINYVAEVQVGQFKGNSNYGPNLLRDFRTRYLAGSVRVQLQAGQFINYYNRPFLNAMKNLYISTGLGAMYNRTDLAVTVPFGTQSRRTTRSQASNYALFLPARLGYEFKIFNSDSEPFMKIDIGYQFNYVFGDRLDGNSSGNSNDLFNQVFIGFKFAVPGVATYKRPI